MVLSIAMYGKNEVVKNDLLRSDIIRRETLRRCYTIKGFEYLPIKEKNRLYDKIKAVVENLF